MFKDTATGINRWFGQACTGRLELHSTTKKIQLQKLDTQDSDYNPSNTGVSSVTIH